MDWRSCHCVHVMAVVYEESWTEEANAINKKLDQVYSELMKSYDALPQNSSDLRDVAQMLHELYNL